MILRLFLFWRIGLFIVTYLGSKAFPVATNGGLGSPTVTKPFSYWLSWAQWDGGYYFNIAKRGYLFFSDYAFFPMYPYLINLISKIFHANTLLSGLLLSNISLFLFLVIFYDLVKRKYPKSIAFNSTITFLTFPTTFFAAAYYSEGLFLFLTALCFFFLYRKRLLFASIIVCLASLTRFVGIALIISLFYNYFSLISFNIKKISLKILNPLSAAIGILSYTVFLFSKLNDPVKFISSQSFWQRSSNDPVSTIVSYLWTIATNPKLPLDQYFDLGITLLFLAILILGIKKLPSSLWIFSILVILIPASTGTLTSMSRYALSSLGTFIIIGEYLKDHPKLKLPVWGASLVIQAIFAMKFVNGFWVA